MAQKKEISNQPSQGEMKFTKNLTDRIQGQKVWAINAGNQYSAQAKQLSKIRLSKQGRSLPLVQQNDDLSQFPQIPQLPKLNGQLRSKVNSIQYSPRKENSTSCIMSSNSHSHQEQILNLKSQLQKKQSFIKYLERKLGNHIIQSMKKMTDQIDKLQRQNEILSANLRVTQGNNLRYLRNSLYQSYTPPAQVCNRKNAFRSLKQEQKKLKHKLVSQFSQTDTILKAQKETQSEKDGSLKVLQKQNDDLKNLIEKLNLEIQSLREQFSALKDKVQNCFETIEEIEPFSPRKSDSVEYPYKPKTEVQRNYCDLLEILEIQWEYYEKPQDIHEIVVLEVRNILKQNKKMLQKFKKVQKESKSIQEEKESIQKMYQQQKSNNIQIGQLTTSLKEALENCNQELIYTQLKFLNTKYSADEQQLQISIYSNSETDTQEILIC